MSADFWAGYLSGAASIAIGNPLDLIKVRLQAAPTPPSNAPSIGPHNQARSPYSALSDARTLLRGLPAPVLTYGALNALLYTSYNRTLALFAPNDLTAPTIALQYSYLAYFSAGAISGLATFVISTPTELIKCRAQAASPQSTLPATITTPLANNTAALPQPPSSWKIARTTLRLEGLRGLYLGGSITAARDGIGYGFYFWTYEACKAAMENYTGNGRVSKSTTEAVKVLLAGGIAGVVTWASIYPLDVVKTRMQTQIPQPTLSELSRSTTPLLGSTQHEQQVEVAGKRRYQSSWTIAKRAYRTEGTQVFFRGLGICCVRAFIVSAAQWAVYEWMMQYLSEG